MKERPPMNTILDILKSRRRVARHDRPLGVGDTVDLISGSDRRKDGQVMLIAKHTKSLWVLWPDGYRAPYYEEQLRRVEPSKS